MAGNPSSSHEIGTVSDRFANDDLQIASSLFEHKVRAQVLIGDITELSGTDVQELALFGQFACATPAFGKLMANAARYVLAARHEHAAARLSGFLRD